MRGPRTDARQRDELALELGERLFRTERDAPVEQRLREAADRRRACARDAAGLERRVGERRRAGKQHADADLHAVVVAPTPVRRDARGERARRRDADLLSEHRAHRKLEAVPGARQPLARPAPDQRTEHRIGAETHTIFIAEVLKVSTRRGPPLVYFERTFTTLAD